MKNFATAEWEKEISEKLVERCAENISNNVSKPVDAFGFQCSSTAGEFVYCMWRELFLSCPRDKQLNTKRCDKLRKVLDKYDDNKFKNV